ncbi:MAG: Gfo/Idh/MocA family oxidoreductase [Desulfobacteraceae bacterium]|jgi:predicted dehydrogenase
MHSLSPISVLIVDDGRLEEIQGFIEFLSCTSHMHVTVETDLPADLSKWDVVVGSTEPNSDLDIGRLASFADAGGGWLNLIGPMTKGIPSIFGVRLDSCGPLCELRVLFDKRDHPLAVRLPDAIYVKDHYHPLVLQREDIETILYTDWHYQQSPVMVVGRHGGGRIACTTLSNFSHPALCRILHRLIRCLADCQMAERPLGVGILGYAPSVGAYHGQGIVSTPGLELRAACDLSPERLRRARADFSEIQTTDSVKALGHDTDIDLVIIATPPNTHADLSIQLMSAGKHVVCEKPLALNRAEAAAMAETAEARGVHLSCHQNRRWDVDYLAIKQALAENLIGDLFYMETFVGGYSHPCGYWHSDVAVSGGTTFDWGGHYIDWIVGLCGGRIASVVGTRHKRVWHDVTNADQERIQIRFEDGREAEFMHSDIAAARKPKWYLLGTRGAIIGRWQDVTEYQIDRLHYFRKHDIPATEMPPDLTVYRCDSLGKVSTLKPALPDRPLFGFHRNLADHLLMDEPLTAPLEDSMQVVAVLEAAARSMACGGRVEMLDAC